MSNLNQVSNQTTTHHRGHRGVNHLTRLCRGRRKKHRTKYLYDPFGNMLSMYGSLADANSYRFSSKEWNQNSGLYYYLYRLYDANAQRWLNRDCLGETGFEVLRGHNNTRELALRTRVGPIGRNL